MFQTPKLYKESFIGNNGDFFLWFWLNNSGNRSLLEQLCRIPVKEGHLLKPSSFYFEWVAEQINVNITECTHKSYECMIETVSYNHGDDDDEVIIKRRLYWPVATLAVLEKS